MPTRFVPPAALVVLAAVLVALAPAQEPKSIYRDGFAGRDPSFVKGDANVKFEEKDHKISNEHGKSGVTSEFIKIESTPPAGAVEAQFVHYYYETPPAPITDRLTAGVWVKAFRPGIQVKARVVFPKEKDPRNPDAPLTTLIAGKTYEKVRQWDVLGFDKVSETLTKQLPVLHARLGRAVDRTDAYIDRIVLNVHAGPGVTEVWIDDLEIGPVRTDVAPPQPGRQAPGGLASRPKAKGRKVEFDGQILVEGDDGVMEPFFMLAIRHSDTPLKTLRDARFNTVWFPYDAPQPTVDEAIRHGFWIVPTLPLSPGEWDARQPKKPAPAALEQEADRLAAYLRKFLAGDAVLMWSLGENRTAEDVARVRQASDHLRSWDPRRPKAVDLWDGYSTFAPYVDAVGAHRWPLFSGLEMVYYREWLAQRRALIPPGKMTWTWVQTHLPGWLAELVCGQADPPSIAEPIGPHPEQIRILTYLSLAAGHKGLGFWSDKYLDTLHHGRDRMLELALLNTEIDMLKPVLFGAEERGPVDRHQRPERAGGGPHRAEGDAGAAGLAGVRQPVHPVPIDGAGPEPDRAEHPGRGDAVARHPGRHHGDHGGESDPRRHADHPHRVRHDRRRRVHQRPGAARQDRPLAGPRPLRRPGGRPVRPAAGHRAVPQDAADARPDTRGRRPGPARRAVGRVVPPGRGVHPPGEGVRGQQPVRGGLPRGPARAAALTGADARPTGRRRPRRSTRRRRRRSRSASTRCRNTGRWLMRCGPAARPATASPTAGSS